MEWLNYHHLLYFWVVAREGSLAQASQELRLTQSTISTQIHTLEGSLGEKLFEKKGRKLVLTQVGQTVFRYAEEIFALGQELQETLKGKQGSRPLSVVVGIADVVPKLVASRLLKPAMSLAQPVNVICRDGKPDKLLADLATHHVDVVLADAPVHPSFPVRAFNHLLGECGVVFLATPELAIHLHQRFPQSLDGAALLLPTENTAMRRSLDQWFSARNITPRIVGEFEDSALLEAFGQSGAGIFPVAEVIAEEVQQKYGLVPIGSTEEVKERYYAISISRRLKHPAIMAITREAREKGFE